MERKGMDVNQITERVKEKSPVLEQIKLEVGKVIKGQNYMVERLLVGLLAGGHVLIEGVPGLAKTTLINTLAQTMKAIFSRIQFTPDLLPSDIIGTLIFNPKEANFTSRQGPIFGNLVLADEINRAPAKVQSALLEAMQEMKVTIGDQSYDLPRPFMVMATQNPIEQEGTYPLPEAQVDRFMLKLKVSYPEIDAERAMIDQMLEPEKPQVNNFLTLEDVNELRKMVSSIYVDNKLRDYVLNLVRATRFPKEFGMDIEKYIEFGASPRANINLVKASQAMAFMKGRGYVTPQDIKSIAPDILRHRILVTYEAEAEGLASEDMINRVFESVEIP